MSLLDDPQSLGLLGVSLLSGKNDPNQSTGSLLFNAAAKYALLKNLQNNNGYGTTPSNAENYNPFPNAVNTAPISAPAGDGSVYNISQAIAHLESGGNYGALGPNTKTGDRAYGKYQIMGANIPQWTQEALGRAMTPQEFIANPQAQDAVAQYKMGQYYNKYQNPQDVAAMWFSGRPLRNNYSKDVLGTSVPKYVSTVISNLKA